MKARLRWFPRSDFKARRQARRLFMTTGHKVISTPMKIADFTTVLPAVSALSPEVEVTGVTSDFRAVRPGMIFVAVPGSKADGSTYAADAERRGALAIVAGEAARLDQLSVPVVTVDDPRLVLAYLSARYYGAQPETMVAVTGTSGKTSVASFTRQIWEHAGFASASIGTTGVVAPGRNEYGSLTTPDPVALHKLLAELAEAGVTHAAMEASSHGLDQRRLDGVRLSAGAFTNLGRDHMDYHPTVEDYLRAKLRLFDTLLPKSAPAVIFADDVFSEPTITGRQSCRAQRADGRPAW